MGDEPNNKKNVNENSKGKITSTQDDYAGSVKMITKSDREGMSEIEFDELSCKEKVSLELEKSLIDFIILGILKKRRPKAFTASEVNEKYFQLIDTRMGAILTTDEYDEWVDKVEGEEDKEDEEDVENKEKKKNTEKKKKLRTITRHLKDLRNFFAINNDPAFSEEGDPFVNIITELIGGSIRSKVKAQDYMPWKKDDTNKQTNKQHVYYFESKTGSWDQRRTTGSDRAPADRNKELYIKNSQHTNNVITWEKPVDTMKE